MVLITTGLSLLGPYLMGLAIDQLSSLAHDLPGLARLVVLMLVTYAGAVARHMAADDPDDPRRPAHRARPAPRPVRQAANAAAAFFDGHTHGELMSRLTNDVENVNTVLTNSVTSFISAIFTLIGVIVVMLARQRPAGAGQPDRRAADGAARRASSPATAARASAISRRPWAC